MIFTSEKKININSEPDKYRDYKFTKWMTKNMGLQVGFSVSFHVFFC